MREILFRGKRKDNGEWSEGQFLKREGCYIAPVVNSYMVMGGRGKGRRLQFGDFYEAIPETVGEFTGLYDTKGEKLFEGDIVKDISSEIGVVTYGEFNCSCCYGVYGWTIDGGDIRENVTIIGNVYDNAEIMLKHIDNQVFAYSNKTYYKERARNLLKKHKDKFPEELVNEYLKRWE